MEKLKLGTRGSKLALAQAEITKKMIEASNPSIPIAIVIVKTAGDILSAWDRVNENVKAAFTRDIEKMLLEGLVDVAVHSMKDLPSKLDERLAVIATPVRGDPRDALITRSGKLLQDLPHGAKIGTSSVRRKYQLLEIRKDLEIVELHGNVETRIHKLFQQKFDGIVVSACGLQRLGLDKRITQVFSIDEVVPAACQGIIAVEARRDDIKTKAILQKINNDKVWKEALCERAFLEEIEGDCNMPVGVCSSVSSNKIKAIGFLSSDDGVSAKYSVYSGEEPAKVGRELARRLLKKVASYVENKGGNTNA